MLIEFNPTHDLVKQLALSRTMAGFFFVMWCLTMIFLSRRINEIKRLRENDKEK